MDAIAALRASQAQTRLLAKSRQYDSYSEIRKSDGTVKHKCFLSYHSDDAVEVEAFVNAYESVFIPRVVGISDEYGKLVDSYDDAYVMNQIRQKYLTDSTVTIVFVGKCTSKRKFVDWEVYSSRRDDSKNKRNGLVAIQLKSNSAGSGVLPSRVRLNVGRAGTQTFGRYWAYPNSLASVRSWIQDGFDARTSRSAWVKLGDARQKYDYAC